MSFPRFNRYDFGPIKTFTGDSSLFKDSDEYVAYVKYFRGENIHKNIRQPFIYRPFVPFVASLLPFSPLTSLNIINLVSLLISVFMLYRLLLICGIPFNYSIVGCLMFVFSFPAFYYGTVGYIDPVLILFLILCTYFIITEKTAPFIITLIIGCVVKETIIIIIPVYILYNYLRSNPWKLPLVILLLSYLGVMWIIRTIYPDKAQYLWSPSFDTLTFNITRLRAWVSNIFTLGIPGFLFIILSIKQGWRKTFTNKPLYYSLVAGFFLSLTLTLFAAMSAYLDGRYVWTSYPFSIPLSLLLLMSKREAKIEERE